MEENKTNFRYLLNTYNRRLSQAIITYRKSSLSNSGLNLEHAIEAADNIDDMITFLDLLDKAAPEERLFHLRRTIAPIAGEAMLKSFDTMSRVDAMARKIYCSRKDDTLSALSDLTDALEEAKRPALIALKAELQKARASDLTPTQRMLQSLTTAIGTFSELIDDTALDLPPQYRKAFRTFKTPLHGALETLCEASDWVQMGKDKGEEPHVYLMGALDAYGKAKSGLTSFFAEHKARRQLLASRLQKDSAVYRHSPQGRLDRAAVDLLDNGAVVFERLDRHMTHAAEALRRSNPARAPLLVCAH